MELLAFDPALGMQRMKFVVLGVGVYGVLWKFYVPLLVAAV